LSIKVDEFFNKQKKSITKKVKPSVKLPLVEDEIENKKIEKEVETEDEPNN
jgi:hypothetical protein